MKRMIAVLSALLLILAAQLTAFAATESELKKKQADLEAQQSSITSKINRLESDQADAQEQVAALNELIDNLESQIDTVNQKILVQENEIADLQAEIDLTEAQIAEAYNGFKARVRSMYITGNITGGLELLLSAKDFDDYLSVMTYIDIMAAHDNDIVQALTEDKEGYFAQKALVEERRPLHGNLGD